jgi:hypothetical protein
MGNVYGLDQAISEVQARGFDIQLQIEKGGYFEFSISGKKRGSGYPFTVQSARGDIANSSVPMRIIETLIQMEGTL